MPDIFKGLDEQQASAVSHINGPAIIIAGAGAGKTTILVRRTANLIKHGIKPQNILLLTFTRAASKSILNRAKAFAPECEQVSGGTFHSIAAKIIRENHEIFGLPKGFTILDPSDVEDCIRTILDENYEKTGVRASTIAKTISFSVNTKTPIRSVVLSLYPKYMGHLSIIEDVSKKYIEYKKNRHILDFDDLLLFFAAMASHEDGGKILSDQFTHIMVDEHQDSNALQIEIINSLSATHENIMVVGDPAQSIYKFRGATPGAMIDFHDYWPDIRVYLIETNYRSTPEIVACANAIDNSMQPRFDRTLRSSRQSIQETPNLICVPTQDFESQWISDTIMHFQDEGIEFDEQAVLVRSTRMARHVELALSARGIPYKFMGGIKIHESAHIKDIMSILRIMSNHRDEPSWTRFLSLMNGIGQKTAHKIAKQMSSQDMISDSMSLLHELAQKKKSLNTAYSTLYNLLSDTSPSSSLIMAKNLLEPLFSEKWGDEWDWRSKDVDAVIDLSHSYETIEDFLRTVTIDVSFDRFGSGARDPDERKLTVATIHSSKGLEWKVVYIPSFIDGHIPTSFISDAETFEEEKRLFYVATTRAKDYLYFVKPQEIFVNGSFQSTNSSYFEPIVNSLLIKKHLKDKIEQVKHKKDILISVR